MRRHAPRLQSTSLPALRGRVTLGVLGAMRPQAGFGDLLGGTTVRDSLAPCPLEELTRRAAELAACYREDRIEIRLEALFQKAAKQERRGGIGDEVRQDRDGATLQLRLRLRRHRVVRGFDQQAA